MSSGLSKIEYFSVPDGFSRSHGKLPTRVYHLAEAQNWPFIKRDGLLSASRLLNRAGVPTELQARWARTQRREHTELPNGVQLRDQRPMPPRSLEDCLCGMTPAEWYAAINERVFFWLDPDRLNRQKSACEPRRQIVIVVDTSALVMKHYERVALTPINTGNARRKPARRGVGTFVPLALWVESGWGSEAAALGGPLRNRSHRPVELTVLNGVPDLMRFVIDVVPLRVGHPFMANARNRATL